MLNKFDIQQLTLIKEKILSFQKWDPDLKKLLFLTRSLEELLNSLENVEGQLKERLTTEWWELELISSVMMDKEVDVISEESKQSLCIALENMLNMIDAVLLKA